MALGVGGGGGLWVQAQSSAATGARGQQQQLPMASLSYGLADVGTIGLRDVLVVAPAASFYSPHHHYHHTNAAAAATLLSPAEHAVIPLLAAAPSLVDDLDTAAAGRARVSTGMNLWQNQPSQGRALESHNPIGASPFAYFGKPTRVPVFDATSATAATAAGILGGNFGGSGGSVGGLMGGGATGGLGPLSLATCQDCGNQAKKDCSHRRCRTCCKSRGLDCATHVKSTWVPAARRRESQSSAAAALPGGGGAAVALASTSSSKKPRLLASDARAAAATATITSRTSTSNTTTPRSLDTGSSHQDASFRESLPGQVRAPAVFKCVRVTTVDDGEDEFAYQAIFRTGGHIFKGILYDQGVAEEAAGGSKDGGNSGGMPNISVLHLGAAAAGGGGPSTDVYATAGEGGGGLMGSRAYGNPIN